jgi:hypothetical protein
MIPYFFLVKTNSLRLNHILFYYFLKVYTTLKKSLIFKVHLTPLNYLERLIYIYPI